jgi:hypothetical protein
MNTQNDNQKNSNLKEENKESNNSHQGRSTSGNNSQQLRQESFLTLKGLIVINEISGNPSDIIEFIRKTGMKK